MNALYVKVDAFSEQPQARLNNQDAPGVGPSSLTPFILSIVNSKLDGASGGRCENISITHIVSSFSGTIKTSKIRVCLHLVCGAKPSEYRLFN
jgi:hypothetical protein